MVRHVSSLAFRFSLLLLSSVVTFGFAPAGLGLPLIVDRRFRVSSPLSAAAAAGAASRESTGAPHAAAAAAAPPPSCQVEVFDNVFHPAVCEVLRALSVEGTLRRDSEDTCIFTRPPFNLTALTPLEHAMDSSLSALGDSSRVVEYWSRDEFMNIDAHVDIDEVELEDEDGGGGGLLRAPEYSHVLYLRVQDELQGKCPTCVFPGQRLWWNDSKVDVDLVTIPAVRGRLLRFPGDTMHAVPCPANRWSLTEEEEAILRKEEAQEEEEAYDDDYRGDNDEGSDDDEEDDEEEDDEVIERAVLLFNTWSDEGPPPRDVSGDYESESSQTGVAQRVAEWEADYGVDAELLRCAPKSMWREVCVTEHAALPPDTSKEAARARISLMGEQERRRSPDSVARVFVSREQLQGAVDQDTSPSWLHLQQGQ